MLINPEYSSQAEKGSKLLSLKLRDEKFYAFYKEDIIELHRQLYPVVQKAQDLAMWPEFSVKKIKLLDGETLTDLLLANAVALALEYNQLTKTDVFSKANEYYDELASKRISLASPFFNKLREGGNLSSCFIMEVGDSLESIMKHLTYCARISKARGGVGVYVGKIRGKGASIGASKNAASSVMAWVRLFDQICVSVNQLGARPGAITVALPLWHIDIQEFLDCQTENGDLRSKAYNIQPQVCVDDVFMTAVEKGNSYNLYCPKDLADNNIDPSKDKDWRIRAEGLHKKSINARALWKEIQERQRVVGRPYLFFTDNAQNNSPFKNYGNINSANLCCLTSNTKILTESGELPIASMAGSLEHPEFHRVWNGINYSNAPVYKVADNQVIYRVHFTQGHYVDVTEDHNWWIATPQSEVEDKPSLFNCLAKFVTKDLQKGMQLPRVWMPGNNSTSGYLQKAKNYVSKVEKLEGTQSVYCLTEPLRNMVIANGVPTGQCESYSYFEVDKYIHCCNLISINLGEHESLDSISNSAIIATEMVDLSLNLSTIDIPEAQKHIKDFRTVGIGMMGLADWLAKNQSYYSDLDLIEKTQKAITLSAYRHSVKLAQMWGSCGEYKHLNSELWKKLDQEPDSKYWVEMRNKTGIRNAMLLATAPNTSTSLVMGATASFLPPYETDFIDESETALRVVTKYAPHLYLTNQQIPQEFITDATAVMQRWVDAGISMEYLLPEGASWSTNKAFSQNKINAWKQRVKAVYYTRTTEVGDVGGCSSGACSN